MRKRGRLSVFCGLSLLLFSLSVASPSPSLMWVSSPVLPGQAAYIQGSGLANLTQIEIEYEERAWFDSHTTTSNNNNNNTVKKVTATVEHTAINGTSCVVRIPTDLPLAAWTLSLPNGYLQRGKEWRTADAGGR
jgi:hypothetical protein